MKVTETRLKEVIFEEAYGRILDDLIVEELFRVLLEQDGELSDEEQEDAIEQWKNSETLRSKTKKIFRDFDALSPIKRKAAIIAIGMAAATGTQFGSEYAVQAQARDIARELRADAAAERAERFGTAADWSHFRDAATAEGATPIFPDDDEGIRRTRDKFVSMGTAKAPIIGDASLGYNMGTQDFFYTPADQISDDEIMPFVGMTKADWETNIRRWLTEPGGRDRIEEFIGTKGKGHAIFWGYGPRGQLFYLAGPDAPEDQRGMWLPPEWSVAYDVVQKNKARAGNQPSPEIDAHGYEDVGSMPRGVDDLRLDTGADSGVWKENLRKYLHSLATVL